MKITEDDFTITTIYFDGQFWCALIEQCRNGKNFAGRYVFGAEPTNPQILNWMVNAFDKVPLLPVEGRTKIRFKKLAKAESKSKSKSGNGGIPKSLIAFSTAQKEYEKERKILGRKQKKLEKKEKYFLKQSKKKAKK